MSRNSITSILAAALLVSVGTGVAASAAAAGSSSTVSASALHSSDTGKGYAHRGSVVKASQLSVRSFVNASHGFALASVGQAQYPASTTDGGRTWRIDGPHFHVNAADAPDVVTRSGVAYMNTYFAYGGGMCVVVSSDGGNHWWRAYLPGSPVAVEPWSSSAHNALVAIVETNPGRFAVYVTTDGGHHWQLHHGEI